MLQVIRNVVFARIDLAAEAKDAPAKWCLLFPLGETKHRKDFPGGAIRFDAAFCRSLVSNWEAEGKPERAINYFHRGASMPGDVTPIDGKVAAGWMTGLVFDEHGKGPERCDGPGVYLLPKWNDRAKQYILSDELRYLSPEFSIDAVSKATGKPQGPTLFGAALLNDPFLTELPAVAAAETTPEKHMDKKLVCAALGLAETATDEEVNAACQKMCDAKKQMASHCAAGVTALSEQTASVIAKLSATEAEVVKLGEAVKARDAQIAKLAGDAKAREVKAFFDAQVSAFRVAPAEREGFEALAMAHGLDCVRFVEKRPALKLGTEVGVPGEVGSQDKLQSAKTRFDAQVSANEKSGMTGLAAFDAAKVALSEDFRLLFGSSELEAKLAARPE